MTTNSQEPVNELDEILAKHGAEPGEMTHSLKQAIKQLMKELVAEAKPTEKPTDDTKVGSWEEGHQNVGYNRAVIEFEKNLLKALEEKALEEV